MIRQTFVWMTATCLALVLGPVLAEAQFVDSLWIVCDSVVISDATVYLPVYCQLGTNLPTQSGLTAVTLMFQNDVGVTIEAIHWNGSALGLDPTAIEAYVGTPVTWSMGNTDGSTYRGGTSLFTFRNVPNIPSPGTYLLCYLEILTQGAGTFTIGPENEIGVPSLVNTFTYQFTEIYPALGSCDMNVISYTLTCTCLGSYIMNEGGNVGFTVEGTCSESEDQIALSMLSVDPSPPEACSPEPNFPPAVGYGSVARTFSWNPGFCCAGTYVITFRAETVRGFADCQFQVEVNDVNRECDVEAGPDIIKTMPLGAIIEATVIDADEVCGDDEATCTGITIDPPLTEVRIDLPTATVMVLSTGKEEEGDHEICFSAQDGHGSECTDCMTFTVRIESDITMKIKKVQSYTGQQHVCVPVCLTIRRPTIEIAAWEVLMWYDPTAGTVVSVDPYGCGYDSVWAHDPEFTDPDGWEWIRPLFVDGGFEPEYFHYVLEADGQFNIVRVVGVMDREMPQEVTPPIDSAFNDILFSLIVDVIPGWEGHEMFFGFEVRNCTDNTLSDAEGDVLYGPRPGSRPTWLDCAYHGCSDLVELFNYPAGLPGLSVEPVTRGDINCDEVAYSVSDAVMFINYLVFGELALHGCPSIEAHRLSSDIDGDGYCFTVADLIMLLRIVNGFQDPLPLLNASGLVVSLSDGLVSVDGEIGAARFVFAGQGQVRGEDVLYAHVDGRTAVLVYTMENRALSGDLFAIDGDVELESVEAADCCGRPLPVEVVEAPTNFSLAQNFPNPFNATTRISFDLAEESPAKLTIYNVLGQEVATLVDGQLPAGRHQVLWEAGSAPSGIYLTHLKAGGRVTTRKIVLLR